MSAEGSSRTGCSPAAKAGAEAPPRAEAGPQPPLHPQSFKLRFAAQREPGRSYVSLVRPLGMPAVVAGKPAAAEREAGVGAHEMGVGVGAHELAAAQRRVRDAYCLGPRERLPRPATSAQEYGWHAARAPPAEPRLRHHVRDSAWLKARLRVLAADDKLKRR